MNSFIKEGIVEVTQATNSYPLKMLFLTSHVCFQIRSANISSHHLVSLWIHDTRNNQGQYTVKKPRAKSNRYHGNGHKQTVATQPRPRTGVDLWVAGTS